MKAPARLTQLLCALTLVSACADPAPESMVGTLERDRIELKVESNEPILAIHIQDSEPVEAGALVLEQDPGRQQARVDRQSALRDQAAARLAELQRGPRIEAIREARARLDAGEAVTRKARAEYERARDIFDRGLSDQANLDDAQAAWESSQALEQAAREALESLLSGTTVEELRQAQAALDGAEAALRLARLDLEHLKIRAPVEGVMDKVLFEIGERPQAGATVAVLLDSARSYARVYVPEHLKASVTNGSRVEIRLDGVEGVRKGIVRWVSADASFTPYFALTEHDRSRLSFLAEIDIDDALEIPAGLPLEARLPAAD